MCSAKNRLSFTVGCFLSLFQQLCGINAVIFYSNTIFSLDADGNEDESNDAGAKIGTALVGVVNMLATVIAIALLQYFGRKTLLVVGQVTMGISLGLLGLFFTIKELLLVKIVTLAFVAFFEFSIGPIL